MKQQAGNLSGATSGNPSTSPFPPRTDAVLLTRHEIEDHGHDYTKADLFVEAEFAATLERENAEMVEALDLCVNLLSIWKMWTPDYCTAHRDFESLPEIQRAREAVAKARGQCSAAEVATAELTDPIRGQVEA